MKALTKRKQGGALVATSFEAMAGDGLEDVTAHDLPRASLRIAHQMSPICDKHDDKWIEGCEPGMIVNMSTRQLWSGDEEEGGVLVIPVKYVNHVIEWQPNRGGFVGEHKPGSPITEGAEWQETVDGKRVWIAENGNQLVDTGTFHVFLINADNTHDEVVIDMSSSQWETAKNWNAFMRSQRAASEEHPGKTFELPAYSAIYRLYTRHKSNDDGSWHVWKFEHRGRLDLSDTAHLALFHAAADYKQVVDVGVEVDRDQD